MDNNSLDITGGEEGITFKSIALSFFKKCGEALAVEQRGGFYGVQKTNDNIVEIWIPDAKEVSCNTIQTLFLYLKPYLNDEELKEFLEILEMVNGLEQDFIKKSSVDEDIILSEAFYDNPKDKILLETMKQKRLIQYKDLFLLMSGFMKKKNYFEIGGGIF